MPGFLSRVTSGAKSLDVNHHTGIVSHAIETGEYLGASYLAARINTQFGEKAKIRGVEATLVAGLVGKIVALGADIMGYGGSWTPHVNTVSTAMIAVHAAQLGAKHGLEAASKKAGAPALPPKQTVSGELPPAPTPGRFLDLGRVGRIAEMHG